jgi:hypothetical protein
VIDIDKKYRTRDGREVRIYALDGGGNYPVHGAFKSHTGWVVRHWPQDGIQSVFGGSDDLIEVKHRIQRTVWLALYPLDDVWVFSGDCTAVEKGCLACVKVEIDCEEGEGL